MDRQVALQSLAVLAQLLDQHLFPFHNVTPLIHTMSASLSAREGVWLQETEEMVPASKFFKQVLNRLIYNLPDKLPTVSDAPRILPPLHHTSYNALLQYALRHRNHPGFAEDIIEHMTVRRQPPLALDEVGRNIIKRSAVLLRRPRIRKLLDEKTEKPLSDLDYLLSLVDLEGLHEGLLVNTYCLTTQMANLIATGKPQVVIDAIPHLLPSTGKVKLVKAEIRQAVALGPVVFTNVLNALYKMDQVEAAEMVWKLARYAEKQSWKPHNHEARPWCLPVEAHTLMLLIYGKEVKRALRDGNRKVRVCSGMWGEAVFNRLRLKNLHDPENSHRRTSITTNYGIARFMALLVYRRLYQVPARFEHKMAVLEADPRVTIRVGKGQLEVPRPDERFFNAVLDVVGRYPGMRRLKTRLRNPRHYLRMESRSRLRILFQDDLPITRRDGALVGVIKDMVQWGMPIPAIYRPTVVGLAELPEWTPKAGVNKLPVRWTKSVRWRMQPKRRRRIRVL